MRGFSILCALALSACAASGHSAAAQAAPAPSAALSGPVEACLAAAGADRDARSGCIGGPTQDCAERDDAGASTAGMVLCAQGERTQWRELRDRYVSMLRERESPTQIALLDAALAEHPRWAQARCAYGASFYEGGSLARYLGAACMRDAEAELALELHARLFDEP